MSVQELLAFLEKRRGLLDGVAITGGEPLLRPDLADFLRKIKDLGYAVKLDTNGSFPARLKALVEEGLVDYVAMDVKNAPARYGETAGFPKLELDPICESVAFLKSGAVESEFRTTVVQGLHTEAEIEALADWLIGAKRYYLQRFRASEQVPNPALTAPSTAQMKQYLKIVQKKIPHAELRGVD